VALTDKQELNDKNGSTHPLLFAQLSPPACPGRFARERFLEINTLKEFYSFFENQ